jgi:outer membrane protein OmpU
MHNPGGMVKNKTIVVMALMAVSQAGQAQSSVTLYGTLDEGLTFLSNQHGSQDWRLDAGSVQGDRFGIKGAEDLGAGNKAIFMLENGFSTSTGALGQGGLLFGRQSFVGLSSAQWGTITFGHQYDEMSEYLNSFAAGNLDAGFYTVHMGDLDRVGGERIDNAVKYTSPAIGGFAFSAMYGFGGQPGQFSTNSTTSIGAQWAGGAAKIGAAYTKINNATYDPYTAFGETTFGPYQIAPVANGTSGSTKLNTDYLANLGIGASYQLGKALLYALYTDTKISNVRIPGKSITQSVNIQVWEAGVRYQWTPFLSVGLGNYYTKDSNKWDETYGMADYFLSKRTDAYFLLVYQRGNEGAQYAVIQTLPSSSSKQQIAARLGVRHRF